MTQNNQSPKKKRIKVSYWWQPPAPDSKDAPPNWMLAHSLSQLRLPRFGQPVTWRLMPPHLAGPGSIVVMARGIVSEVSKVNPGEYIAVLERNYVKYDLTPLTYEDLHDCLDMLVVGFHPTLGCLEGPLVRLLPEGDLAGIADAWMVKGDSGEVIWVDWSTVYKVSDLEEALLD